MDKDMLLVCCDCVASKRFDRFYKSTIENWSKEYSFPRQCCV